MFIHFPIQTSLACKLNTGWHFHVLFTVTPVLGQGLIHNECLVFSLKLLAQLRAGVFESLRKAFGNIGKGDIESMTLRVSSSNREQEKQKWAEGLGEASGQEDFLEVVVIMLHIMLLSRVVPVGAQLPAQAVRGLPEWN